LSGTQRDDRRTTMKDLLPADAVLPPWSDVDVLVVRAEPA
jgi:hypothetical protein